MLIVGMLGLTRDKSLVKIKGIGLLTTIILTMLAYTASAQTVMYCTGIKGKAIYANEGKWIDDGGSIRLDLVLNNEQLDISIDDLAGPTTIRWMGGEIFFLGYNDGKATLLASYGGGHSELYTYDLNNRKIYLSQHRTTGTVQKFASYTGYCSKPVFNPFF